jgi:hypothetical protein
LKKPDTLRHITFIPSPDDLIEKVAEEENLIENVVEEDDLRKKMGEEDDLIENVVDGKMKTSLDGQREIVLKLNHADNTDEDTKHINKKESTGSISPSLKVLIKTIALWDLSF